MTSEIGVCNDNPYDVIVCGAGHAGCEAALVSSRMNRNVLLLTGNLDTIAQMSCNPAIGGQAKGQMVREIDALGGEMGLNADATAIQFKLLNTSKGPAVQAPRAQCDKKAYQFRMKHLLEQNSNIKIFQCLVDGLIVKNDKCIGVRSNHDFCFYGKTVIVTTGTFLKALMHIGDKKSEGGRLGDHVAKGLSSDFIKYGIELGRFKTGTPPRLRGTSINHSILEKQQGDDVPTKFAFYDTRSDDEMFHVERAARWFHEERKLGMPCKIECSVSSTTEETSQIIHDNLSKSPLYDGKIEGTGPRYCPSIEDKVVKKELIRQREEEIQKRKYSYFSRKNIVKEEDTVKAKQFFDESSIKKTFKKNNEKFESNSGNKKKLEKKSFQKDSYAKQKDKKENELLAAIIKKPSSIVELKEQEVSSKREILMFESNKEELGIKQKKMLKEFANIIKDKPVKIVIKTFFSKKEKNFDKYKKISKSRSLYIRAFLINQGISHNRIKIETNEENVTKNWKNEVILNFIGV